MSLGPTPDVLTLDVEPTQNTHTSLICALWPHQKGWLCCSLGDSCVCLAKWELLLTLPPSRSSVSSPGAGIAPLIGLNVLPQGIKQTLSVRSKQTAICFRAHV